jgi:hypothetical protein
MTSRSRRHTGGQPVGWVRRLATGIVTVVAECHSAQRRMALLASSPERYLLDVGVAPGTYQEFLFRTSGPLMHEPAASGRLAGRAVR